LALAVDIELDDGSVVRRPLDPISGVEFGTLQNGGQDSRDGIEASPPWRFGVAPISGEVGWSANGVRSAVFRSRVFDVDAWDPLIQQEIWLAIDSFVLWIQEFSGVRVWLESPDRGRSVEVPISRLVSETELNQIVGERHSIRVPLDDALRELTPSFRVRAAFFGRDPMLFELRDIRIEARGCPVPLGPADLAVPFGVMTANDIQAFLDAFQSGSLAADLAEPYGVVSQLDIAEFVGQFFGF
ncbi:MAG: GC-type dockerin domain-anchored protein, partial [Planctomycetota bacterium]